MAESDAPEMPIPSLEELQHWTWVMGRAQQMMLESGLSTTAAEQRDLGLPVIPGLNDPATIQRGSSHHARAQASTSIPSSSTITA
jgi:polyhydroxyalkanoate synthase